MDFINRCSVNNAFKINTKDYQTLDFKSEIRFLICRKYFPELQTSDIFLSKITTAKALNKSLDIIQALSATAMNELLGLNKGSGLGPGEALLYFLLDKLNLILNLVYLFYDLHFPVKYHNTVENYCPF